MEHTTHCGLQQAEAARGPRTDESAREAGRVMFTSHQNITPFRLFMLGRRPERSETQRNAATLRERLGLKGIFDSRCCCGPLSLGPSSSCVQGDRTTGRA